MPLTEKGRKVMRHMREQYGEEQGERVFYAMKTAGKLKGVDTADAEGSEGVPERRSEIVGSVSAPDPTLAPMPHSILPGSSPPEPAVRTGDSQLRSMNQANRAFWNNRR